MTADNLVAGIDEVGMGCLAGPVYAAAVILPDDHGIVGLRDSKKLSPRQRERFAAQIRERAIAWAVGAASVVEVDQLNVLEASWLAMIRAIKMLYPRPDLCLVDGGQKPDLGQYEARPVPGGDGTVEAIMAASILAKVERDAEMVRLDVLHPGYGFAQSKGYPTPAAKAALRALGPCMAHRSRFAVGR